MGFAGGVWSHNFTVPPAVLTQLAERNASYPLPYEGERDAVRLSGETRLTLLCTRPAAVAFGADEMLRFRARLLASTPRAPLP